MTVADAELIVRRRLGARLPGPAAQRRFEPHPLRAGWTPEASPPSARHAAALILLYDVNATATLPLTVRHATLPHHPGQISLPGGAIDPGETPTAAALREAREEINVEPDDVTVLGELSTLWVPVSNFVVHPVVGIAARRPSFRLHELEVAALVEVPLPLLRDPAAVRAVHRQREGVPLQYQAFHLGETHVVWGATAMMLGEFVALFADEAT